MGADRNLYILGAHHMIRYLVIVPAVLMAACVALYVWAAFDPNPFEKWEEAYD